MTTLIAASQIDQQPMTVDAAGWSVAIDRVAHGT